ncbi:hypothetical protein ACVWWG_007469 [Bradyrhizobium sp. LB7.2]
MAHEFIDTLGHRKVFDLKSPVNMLEKLRWEIDQIKALDDSGDQKVIFAAFNAAATAWHIIDWVKTHNRVYPKERVLALEAKHYRDDATKRCPQLRICRQISVGWKHRIVDDNNDPAIQAVAVINIYVRQVDGKIYPSDRRYKQTIGIYDGKTRIPVVEFFEHILSFWTDELMNRLKFREEFSLDFWPKSDS